MRTAIQVRIIVHARDYFGPQKNHEITSLQAAREIAA